jgi:hypothetical protein
MKKVLLYAAAFLVAAAITLVGIVTVILYYGLTACR